MAGHRGANDQVVYGVGMTGTFQDNYLPTRLERQSQPVHRRRRAFLPYLPYVARDGEPERHRFHYPREVPGYADRIKAHVFDRGTMPLALIVYNDFWNSSAPSQLANFINPSLAALTPPQTATTPAALLSGRAGRSPIPAPTGW